MILPNRADAIHKAWLNRILSAVADDSRLVQYLGFKGGTCAAMRGLIERFSVDLDFDLMEPEKNHEVGREFEKIFHKLNLEIYDKSSKVPQYFLKYPSRPNLRNTIKIDVTFPIPENNEYEPVRFVEIDRIMNCQTVPTMFANKLVAMMERHEKYGSIAGRDLFDIHTFFLKGCGFKKEIIAERTGKAANNYLRDLKIFIEKFVTQNVVDQDLNMLLPPGAFRKNRMILKHEVLMFLSQATTQ